MAQVSGRALAKTVALLKNRNRPSALLNLRDKSSLSPAEKWRKFLVALLQNWTRLSSPLNLRHKKTPVCPLKMAQASGRGSAKPDAAVHAVESSRQIRSPAERCRKFLVALLQNRRRPVYAVESLRQIRPPAENAASCRLRFCKTGCSHSARCISATKSSHLSAEKWRKPPVAFPQNRTRPVCAVESLRQIIPPARRKWRKSTVAFLQNQTRPVCAVESPRGILSSAR